MSPSLLFASLLAHISPARRLSDEPGSESGRGDPEKTASSSSGDGQDHTDNNEDDNDNEIEDLDDFEEQGDIDSPEFPERGEDGLHPRQGVPLSSNGTISSSSVTHFSRPFLPRFLLKIKEVLFGSHHHEDHDDVLPNYRRTPIISGSLIPFSILLEIPALTEHWYVQTSDGKVVQELSNPPLVTVAMSLSMALAVFANVALIFRFLERNIMRSTILCIVTLTLHDILNVVTIIIFSAQHHSNDGFTFSEAFWMTICSTIISTITNLTLIWDLFTTPHFAKAGSGVTRKQRSLVVITIIFLTYIAMGALISSLMMSLSFVNGLFFTIVTTLTIGFGDIVPVTAAQRVVVCLYAVLGIIILGAGVRLTAEAVLEGLQVGYHRRLQVFKKRRKERKRERELVRRWRTAVEERLVARNLEVWTADNPAHPPVRPTTLRRGSTFVGPPMYLNTEALPADVLESAAREAGVPLEKFIGRKFGRRTRQHHPHPQHHHHHHHDDQQQQEGKEGERPGRVPMDFTWTIDDGAMKEQQSESGGWGIAWWERARQALRLANAGDSASISQDDPSQGLTYQEMMKTLERDERRSLYTKLGLSWVMFFTFWTIGSVIFSNTEGWEYGSAMYFCFIAFTTIGYGDLAPQTAIGRSIFVFWALFGVGAMTILIAVLSDAFSSKYHSVTQDKKFDRAVRRYRQGQEKAAQRRERENRVSRKRRSSQVVPALRASLARISSREPALPSIAQQPVLQPALTVAEAEARLRSRIEPLPAMILKEVLKLRDHTRYFLIANGHAEALSLQGGPSALAMQQDNAVPEDLKKLLDEIAQEEGFEERLKQEVWDDTHARNTLFVLSLEKGARRMVEAAELALETLSERNKLVTTAERGIMCEEPEEM